MKYVLTAAQMREADRFTMENLGVPSLQLMERAGTALFAQAIALAPTGKILLVAGGGNNGGDGFVAGRKLLLAGREVDAVLLSNHCTQECEINLSEYLMNGGTLYDEIPEKDYVLVLDCLFGTGYSYREDERVETVIRKVNALKRRGAKILSADLPSGVNGENGLVEGVAVDADVTLCIGEIKTGALLGDGMDFSGMLVRADIGIVLPAFDENGNGYAHVLEDDEISSLILPRKHNSHKGTYGRATIVGGSEKYTGAAYLSTAAALRSGAGYTCLYTPANLLPLYALKLPEVLLSPLNEGGRVAFNEESYAQIPHGAVAYGMGMETQESVAIGAEYLISHHVGTLILDADALNSLAEYSFDRFDEIFSKKTCDIVITPHVKEFARLLRTDVKTVLSSGFSLAEEFAKRYGVTVLLKGAATIITDGTRTAINVTGTAGQAKGGSGDVLSGAIAGLCASMLSAYDGACAAAFLCGRAAEIATADIGEYSLTPTDVIAYMGRAFLSIRD